MSRIIRGVVFALAAIIGSACASTSIAPGLTGPATGDVQAMIDKLAQDVDELGSIGMDVSGLEQHLRLARVKLEEGDNAHAEDLVAGGLELADEVRGKVDEIIRAELEERDRRIRIALTDLEDYLREGWELGADLQLADLQAQVATRNERAALTNGKVPVNEYRKRLGPMERVVKDIAASQVETDETSYKKKFRMSLAKLRGNESLELQEAMARHVEDDYYKAKKSYLAALRAEPQSYKALQNLGIMELELGEYAAAANHLQDAFAIGLKLDETAGEWWRDFVPDVAPLVAAYRETAQTARVAKVTRRREDRVAEVLAAAEERDQQREEALENPETQVEEQGTQVASSTDDDKCKLKPVAGKVQMIAEGMDTDTVREIICAPESLKLLDTRAYWYYATGTVVFEDDKVIETSAERLAPETEEPGA